MPIDEAVLAQAQADIRAKLDANSLERQAVKKLLQDANSIEQLTVSDATPENPSKTKKIMPKDKALGKDMDIVRRQEIYDKVIADKTALGI